MGKGPSVFGRAEDWRDCPIRRFRVFRNERRTSRALPRPLSPVGNDRIDVRSRIDVDPQIIRIAVEQAAAHASRFIPT